jgi:hypothetical protein
VGRQPQLLDVVRALHPVGGLPDLLHRGQQEADQDRNDRNNDEQLDEGETGTTSHHDNSSLWVVTGGPADGRGFGMSA